MAAKKAEIQRIGIVGCGNISGIYLTNLKGPEGSPGMFSKRVKVTALTDLIPERAEKASEKYGIPYIKKTSDLINSKDVDIVLNITEPYNHYGVSIETVKAGKHIYSEKPMCVKREEAQDVLKAAAEKKVRVGNAPDTFLGAGIQTCRKLIDDGYIGDPVGAACFMICHGHETWHPDPEFYYKFGGGPMFDMGPYYITALVNLLGGIKSVVGVAKKSFPTRTITSQPHYGEIVTVDVNTHVVGILNFASGAVGTIITTFDAYYPGQARFEVYGSKGTLFVPDPNTFGGPVSLLRPENGRDPVEVPLLFDYKENSRALGLADMAKSIATGRAARASYKQTYHVLEALASFDKTSESGRVYEMQTRYEREAPMQNNPMHGILD